MNILFTGGSSFSGYWFVRALVMAGHSVTCTLRRPLVSYRESHPRSERVDRLLQIADVVDGVSFGDEEFRRLIRRGTDVVAHHGATVADYRDPKFNIMLAVSSNANGAPEVMEDIVAAGAKCLVLTGTLFEPRVGVGTDVDLPITAYGLAKGITSELFEWYAREAGVVVRKFIMPNPFGPLEEARFCRYAYKCWMMGNAAVVKTPLYIRDNIHIDLLALAYARFVEEAVKGVGPRMIGPSGYVETQGNFALRLAREVGDRLARRCEVIFQEHDWVLEPRIRVNAFPADQYVSGWCESDAWDEVARFAEMECV